MLTSTKIIDNISTKLFRNKIKPSSYVIHLYLEIYRNKAEAIKKRFIREI